MPYAKLVQLARQFPENGMKLMLEDPQNVRDLLALLGTKWLGLIAFDRLKLVQTTFVERDFSQVESDVVLIAPLRGRRRDLMPPRLMIYILIEHQSEPDRLMPLRMLEYVVQIYKYQTRSLGKSRSFRHGVLAPVLPVVFYTGTRRWDSIGTVADLIAMGARFGNAIPGLQPLFVNLRATPAEKLARAGGFFGRVLRLVQQRRARSKEFQDLLHWAVQQLEGMPQRDRRRWLELLSYVHALVYHERDPAEHRKLQETIEASLRTDEHRQEVFKMGKTIAQSLIEQGIERGIEQGIERGIERGMEKGEVKARRSILIRQLHKRFGELPNEMVLTIEATEDTGQLDGWLERVVTAKNLKEVGI
jgi:hypothetical protein